MKTVKIYKLQNDGKQKIIATCRMSGRTAVCQGEENFVKSLEESGIFDYSESAGKKLFPKDGIKFLENLKDAFKSGYLMAADSED